MSTLSELTSKADYIASRNHLLKSQWHTYQNSLIQAVNALSKKINHEFICGGGDDIRFMLFNHFTVSIHLSDDFFSHEVIYSLNIAPPAEAPRFTAFAQATLSEDGCIDDVIIRDKPAVLDHYLNKISAIYQCLFDALQMKQPVYLQLAKLLDHQ
jgi:formate hydrogenlyase regulatory protein HycA